jgi:hypothetical protein
MVLYSGNHEIIGVRHRASQTLHVSEVIRPHESDPAYGKIQVGIYIAAIMETIDRIGQQDAVAHTSVPRRQQQNDKGGKDSDGEGDEDEDGHHSKRARMDESQPSKGPENGGSTRAYTSEGQKRSFSGNVDQACH